MDRFAAHVLERLPDAVSIVGPDGVQVHTNRAANAILDDLGARHEGQPIGNVAWNAIDAAGRPLPNAHLPVEITRLTGRECSRVEVGYPDSSGEIRWLQIS